jgi:CheY-like chemotaxis protein
MRMSRRILVVDDEKQIRHLIRAAIAAPDVDVLIAADAAEALALARENRPLELVVTDIVMPGIDGFELASLLAAEGCAARFLFISGFFKGQEDDPKFEGFGSAAFLAKPFSVPDLQRAVKGILAEEARLEKGVSLRRRDEPSRFRRKMDPLESVRAGRLRSERLLERQYSLLASTRAGILQYQSLYARVQRNLKEVAAFGLYKS